MLKTLRSPAFPLGEVTTCALALLIIAGCGGSERDAGAQIETPSGTKRAESAAASAAATPPLPDSAFRVEWRSHSIPSELEAGEAIIVEVSARNASDVPWPDPSTAHGTRKGAGAVRLGYRWWPVDGPTPGPGLGYSRARADLESALSPGDVTTFRIELEAPRSPGSYKLEVDLVQELVAWFGTRGSIPLLLEITVR